MMALTAIAGRVWAMETPSMETPSMETSNVEALVVRRATLDDAAGVARVLNEAILGDAPSLLDTAFSDDDERAYIAALPERAFIHVAELPGEGIVGVETVTTEADYSTHELDHVATMGTWVAARRRRHGIGRRLAEASFAAAREVGFEKIFTDIRADNVASLGFHLSLGFVVVGTARRHAKAGERYVDVVFVEKFL